MGKGWKGHLERSANHVYFDANSKCVAVKMYQFLSGLVQLAAELKLKRINVPAKTSFTSEETSLHFHNSDILIIIRLGRFKATQGISIVFITNSLIKPVMKLNETS